MKLYFRDVQHNPELIKQLRDLSYVNESISNIHADHVGVKTFRHDLEISVEEAEYGLDQSCDNINNLSAECEKDKKSCQYAYEYMEDDERAIRKIIQILKTLERVCTLENYLSSEIIITLGHV